jgi:isopentenyl phosphate kinase
MKPITIIKFGGSVITDKSTPFSFRPSETRLLITQIQSALSIKSQTIILIHGGGSFGHPLAQEYKLTSGVSSTIQNQIWGLAKTHWAMDDLNQKIVTIFLELNLPVIAIPPSSAFIWSISSQVTTKKTIGQLKFNTWELLKANLDHNIIPIMYGDIIFHTDGSFGIISGDRVISHLCENITSNLGPEYVVDKVIFCFDQDGIYESKQNHTKHIRSRLHPDEINSLQFNINKNKSDVTGGLKGKLIEAQKIAKCGIPIQFINGLSENTLNSTLLGNTNVGTYMSYD